MPKLMVRNLMAYLPAVSKFALTVAVGCSVILEPILDFLERRTSPSSPRSLLLEAAVAVVLVTLPVTYIMGVTLVYIHVTPPAAAPPPGATRRFADLACTVTCVLLVALAVPLAAFIFLAGSHSPPTGLIPT